MEAGNWNKSPRHPPNPAFHDDAQRDHERRNPAVIGKTGSEAVGLKVNEIASGRSTVDPQTGGKRIS
jgi:hypothetical protein